MKNCLFGLFLLSLFSASSQDRHCATDVVMKAVYDKNPALRLRKLKLDEEQRGNGKKLAANASYVIPIVFHVLHLGGPENISDAQVKDGLRILNRDFAKQNPDTVDIIPSFKNIADSMKIQFALPTLDPQGNCTNGIIHHYDTDTDWNDLSPTLWSHTWDPTKYLNVYLVRTITLSSGFGAAGYTYFPGTFLPGDPNDAIVVLNNYFGSIGTGSSFLSRVLTHEVGHWLDLYHVFGGTNNAGVDCSGDDYVWDTPTTIGYLDCPDPSVPSQYQVCTPGIDENFQNYMDYSYCCRMFTSGQGQRMQFALQTNISGRDNLWSNSNLVATGAVNQPGLCSPIADFKYNRSKTCVGTSVTFTDASWKGVPSSYNWSFPGGTPATSTSSAPVITYNSPGLYSVNYSSSNVAGTSPVISKNNIIEVTATNAAYNSFWTEGFENPSNFSSDWTLMSASGAVNWERSNNASYSGSFSAKLPWNNNTRRTVTAMISPAVNLGSNPSPILSFKLAAAEVSSNHINTLKVYASNDCGATWSPVYNKSGQLLVTSTSTTSNFVPTHNEWRTETIGLLSLAGQSYVNFKFEYTRDTIRAANNVFIDDINITTGTLPPPAPVGVGELSTSPQNLTIYPVPSNGQLNLEFTLAADQRLTIALHDVSGRLIGTEEERSFEAGANKCALSLQNGISPGIYFLTIKNPPWQTTRKITVE